MQFYTKDDSGEYQEADADEVFKDRKQRWEEQETKRLKEEAEESVRDELTESITSEVESKVKSEYESKLNEANSKNTELETSLRRKTIAAEYGFKPETEKYLGNGSDEEMRKEADVLKNNFGQTTTPPDKKTASGKSETQKRTGLNIEI